MAQYMCRWALSARKCLDDLKQSPLCPQLPGQPTKRQTFKSNSTVHRGLTSPRTNVEPAPGLPRLQQRKCSTVFIGESIQLEQNRGNESQRPGNTPASPTKTSPPNLQLIELSHLARCGRELELSRAPVVGWQLHSPFGEDAERQVCAAVSIGGHPPDGRTWNEDVEGRENRLELLGCRSGDRGSASTTTTTAATTTTYYADWG